MSKGSLTGKIFFNKFLIGSCIGSGSFGQVYLVYDIQSQQILALKAEQDRTKNPQIMNEARIIKTMNGQKGFVPFHFYGYENKFNVVIMGLLGPSLEDLFNACNRCFSLKTILMLVDQILQRLQTFHSKNYVYRDIKPQNFLMGLHQNSHIVHLVDFGLSKRFRDTKNHQHIPYREGKSLAGTVRYCSINSHLNIQYSRRDDLQSVGYMLQYFFKGSLQWQGIHANTNAQKYTKILQNKQNIPIQIQFMDMPIEFATYMHYVRSLKFADRPDYIFLRKLFSDLMDKLGYKKDYIFDWCKLKHTVKFQNGNMSLSLRNKYSDLQSPYVTFISNDQINIEDIAIQCKQDKIQQDQQVSNFEPVYEQQEQQDQNQGNIDANILQDSELKLISHRNKWFDSVL